MEQKQKGRQMKEGRMNNGNDSKKKYQKRLSKCEKYFDLVCAPVSREKKTILMKSSKKTSKMKIKMRKII